jgi:hypothetical protein
VAGMTVYDATNLQAIGTVQGTSGTTLTLTANASHGSSGASDTLNFSAFSNASGSQPSTITNSAAITFPVASANWGTVVAFGLYDAASAGDLLLWDFMGGYPWLPCAVSSVGSGNGAVFSTHAHGYSNGTPVVVSTEYGGTLPTVTQGALSSYTQNYAANVATDTFTLSSSPSAPTSGNAVWTSSSGDLMARQIVQQQINSGITASFAASALTASAA